jgi:hypothetical protein
VRFLQGERKTPPTATQRLWHGGAGTEKRPVRRLWWSREFGVSTTILEILWEFQFVEKRKFQTCCASHLHLFRCQSQPVNMASPKPTAKLTRYRSLQVLSHSGMAGLGACNRTYKAKSIRLMMARIAPRIMNVPNTSTIMAANSGLIGTLRIPEWSSNHVHFGYRSGGNGERPYQGFVHLHPSRGQHSRPGSSLEGARGVSWHQWRRCPANVP